MANNEGGILTLPGLAITVEPKDQHSKSINVPLNVKGEQQEDIDGQIQGRRAFSLPARIGLQLQEDIEYSVYKAHAYYLQNPNVYDKVTASAVLVYSTFSILATFLGGTQAGLLALFVTDADARTKHSILMYSCIGLSVAALLLHLAVAILSTLLVLFLTLDKIVVAITGGPESSSTSTSRARLSKPLQQQQQPLLFLTAQLEEMESFRKVVTEEDFPTCVVSAVKIISRMRGTFWDMGTVLMVSTLFTLISVYLYSWTSLPIGIVATCFATFNTVLLFRTLRSLHVSGKMKEWREKGIIGPVTPPLRASASV